MLTSSVLPSIIPRPLKLDMQILHHTKAFLSETIVVKLPATSTEEKDFTLFYEVAAEEADSGYPVYS